MNMAQMRQRRGQPLFILSEDTQRTTGRDAQSSNITAGKAVAESVRTTLGPRGMDKMLVSDDGDVVITNDGATILKEMDIEHPAAQMIVEVAETQEEEVGDGTTTAAVLAGRLLAQAEDLLEDDVHPTTIVEGYFEAARFALEAIEEITLEEELTEDLLTSVAESSMTGKGTGDIEAGDLAETVVAAVQQVRDDDSVDRDSISIRTRIGGGASATELIRGVIIDEEPLHDEMPRQVADPTIAVLDLDIEVREAEIDAEYDITNVDQLNAAIEAEEAELRGYADTIVESGADVVFLTGDVEDITAARLAKQGVLVFDDVDSDELEDVARATGARMVVSLSDLEEDDLGSAEQVRVEKFGEDDLAFVEGGAAAETVTIFGRGGTEHVTDELERAMKDALDVVTAAIEAGGVVPGAGATEIAISDHVRDRAASVTGRRQLAIEAFADAIDVLPRTLAENTGMDPIDALVNLRSTFDAEGRAGLIAEGQTGHVDDPLEYGIIDPAAVKREAIESATEAATMIIRIDDVISAE